MNDEQIDRLLDEGLKNYSRVEAPAGFAERAGERIRAAERPQRWWPLPAPGTGPWRWMWVPAAATALLLALWVAVPRPADYPAPPIPRAVIPVAGLSPTVVRVPQAVRPVRRAQAVQGGGRSEGLHVLTPEELASLRLPADLFSKEHTPAPIPDISIPELKIPALEGETAESGSAETT